MYPNAEVNLHDTLPTEELKAQSSFCFKFINHFKSNYFIITAEFLTALSFYGFLSSIVLFFQTELNYSNAEADIQFSYWSAVCNVTPLLGGYLADTSLGKVKVILVFSGINLVGQLLAVWSARPGSTQVATSLAAIYVIALGVGGVQPTMPTLGADQFDAACEGKLKERESFFAWFYWSLNLGAFLSYTVIAYICQYGIPSTGGQEYGFFTGYFLAALSQALCIVVFVTGLFLCGYNQHNRTEVVSSASSTKKSSVVSSTAGILWQACSRRFVTLRRRAFKACCQSFCKNNSVGDVVVYSIVSTRQTEAAHELGYDHGDVLDLAKIESGGHYENGQVDDVKRLLILAPFLLSMVPFWGCYAQMSTAFQNQACQMDLKLGQTRVPVSALNLFDCLAILTLIPVFDRLIYPNLSKIGLNLTIVGKIKIGFVAASLSMVAAALVELARRKYSPPSGNFYDETAVSNISPCQDVGNFDPYRYQQWQAAILPSDAQPLHCTQTCDVTYYSPLYSMPLLNLTCISCEDIPQTSSLSVLWQIPQYSLVGISEILASVTAIELFYSQAPPSLRSLCQALNTGSQALGAIALVPLIYAVNSGGPDSAWLPADLDEGHLDYYFFLLALIMIADLAILFVISANFPYKTEAELSRKHFKDDENAGYHEQRVERMSSLSLLLTHSGRNSHSSDSVSHFILNNPAPRTSADSNENDATIKLLKSAFRN